MASLAAAMVVQSILVPDWVEVAFGLDPDQGSGWFEAVLAGLALVATSLGLLAQSEWQRARAAQVGAGSVD